MSVLYLPLKREYFEAIQSGAKKFEYRLCSEYWKRRLEGKAFDKVVLALGYPKRGDTARRIELPWRGYEVIKIVHPEFGNQEVACFAIKLTEGDEAC